MNKLKLWTAERSIPLKEVMKNKFIGMCHIRGTTPTLASTLSPSVRIFNTTII